MSRINLYYSDLKEQIESDSRMGVIGKVQSFANIASNRLV